MERGLQGTYQRVTTGEESYQMYLPRPLPPSPPLELDKRLYDKAERANRALGRLDGVTTLLPARELFLYLYIRKEAVLSSQIEGTQSSFSDLLLHESGHVPGSPCALSTRDGQRGPTRRGVRTVVSNCGRSTRWP